MDVALVIVPDAGALPGVHRADAQKERQAPGLKDAALGIPERPALAVEQEPLLDGLIAEDRIWALESADVIEGGLANDRVAVDAIVRPPCRVSC